MSDASLFRDFRSNLTVTNPEAISTSYNSITMRLNKDYWDLESETSHSMKIGSWGRHTAINGVSDLDMVFEIPEADFKRYQALAGIGPSTMLKEVRDCLLERYPNTLIKADGQIVGVFFTGFRVEVLPAFLDANGNYVHGDSNNGGSWKTTKPRPEIAAVNALDKATNGNLKHVCKMLRAWKNKAGVGIGGLLVDTFAYKFFIDHPEYNDATFGDYSDLMVSVLSYLGGLPVQGYWLAPGSNQRVRCKAKFQAKARKAAAKCEEAKGLGTEAARAKLWRAVFGMAFPSVESILKTAMLPEGVTDPEQFIEKLHPLDIRYDIEVDCEVKEANVLVGMLRKMRRNGRRLPTGRRLRFFVAHNDVPPPYTIKWKVRNRGTEAIRTNQLRGEIMPDGGNEQREENTSFSGDHYVEVYAIKDGYTVARDRITVPITN